MRLGYLGRLSDLPLNGSILGSHSGISSDLHRAGGGSGTGGHPGHYFYFIVNFMT